MSLNQDVLSREVKGKSRYSLKFLIKIMVLNPNIGGPGRI